MKNGILILGARGMLGGQLRKLYPEAVAWDREEADVLDFDRFRRQVAEFEPAAILNCVAFNDVDGAEDRPEAAFALNAEFPGRLAALAGELNSALVHYSTNYVFDGVAGEYAEDDPPNPLSVYAASKREGELRVFDSAARCHVLRTAVIFGPRGESDVAKTSFIDLMLTLSLTRPRLSVVNNEINSVTYACDLAAATRDILEQRHPAGLYHVTNSGQASWYDLALELFRLTGRKVEVEPVPSSRFPRKARRPAKAVLRNTKLPPLRSWQQAVAAYLESSGAAAPR